MAQVRAVPLGGRLGILVRGDEKLGADAYIGIVVDRSGSMHRDKLERAKAFCTLLAESARGVPGIVGHINAFDDTTFFEMGNFERTSVASLTSGGGNNDSGALSRAAELAIHSRKRHRLLIMISDGSPTECTFESLKNLVARLTRQHETVCVQVAVEPLTEIAFPHHVDLSQYSLDEAVARFGKMIMRLTAPWRS